MKTIEKYIEALENKDFEGLGNLFTRDGHYCDYCPNGTPQHEYHLYGKEAISMGAENISFSTLPNEWRSPYIYLDPDAVLELVNQYLSPYVEDRTAEDLDIPS